MHILQCTRFFDLIAILWSKNTIGIFLGEVWKKQIWSCRPKKEHNLSNSINSKLGIANMADQVQETEPLHVACRTAQRCKYYRIMMSVKWQYIDFSFRYLKILISSSKYSCRLRFPRELHVQVCFGPQDLLKCL